MRMPRSFVPVLALLASPLACAQGSSDPTLSTFSSGAYSAGEGDGSSGDMDSDGATSGQSGTATNGVTSSDDNGSADDGGNAMCCSISPTPGCGSAQTEACVCPSMESCCTMSWGSACVELAIVCGDPNCVDDSGGDTTTTDGPPPECDPSFGFDPQDPAPDTPFNLTFTDPVPLTYFGLWATGPNGEMVEGQNFDITGSTTWHFVFPNGLSAGLWTITFTHRETADGPDLLRGTCDKLF